MIISLGKPREILAVSADRGLDGIAIERNVYCNYSDKEFCNFRDEIYLHLQRSIGLKEH